MSIAYINKRDLLPFPCPPGAPENYCAVPSSSSSPTSVKRDGEETPSMVLLLTFPTLDVVLRVCLHTVVSVGGELHSTHQTTNKFISSKRGGGVIFNGHPHNEREGGGHEDPKERCVSQPRQAILENQKYRANCRLSRRINFSATVVGSWVLGSTQGTGRNLKAELCPSVMFYNYCN